MDIQSTETREIMALAIAHDLANKRISGNPTYADPVHLAKEFHFFFSVAMMPQTIEASSLTGEAASLKIESMAKGYGIAAPGERK
ncbi:MAG: hypothetical protein H7338_10550 [Candidatus Sericytochromatia bacterium]|nr:hypothetical protein [Candidatus Sericytochromatia bacterium]